MVLESDMHCHTVASVHAYSTVLELAQQAAKSGLKAIAVTDHGPALPDGAHPWHFGNLKCLPPFICGVRVVHGAEVNIVDYEGHVDLEETYLKRLQWVIASYHDPCCSPGTPEQHTRSYLQLAENPYIDVIGHCGGSNYRFDYERVLPVFKKNKKLVEINSHSFTARPGSPENCRKIALICKRERIPVVVNSDTHFAFSIGDVGTALQMLREIDFPPELIINLTFERLAEWIYSRRKIDIRK